MRLALASSNFVSEGADVEGGMAVAVCVELLQELGGRAQRLYGRTTSFLSYREFQELSPFG